MPDFFQQKNVAQGPEIFEKVKYFQKKTFS